MTPADTRGPSRHIHLSKIGADATPCGIALANLPWHGKTPPCDNRTICPECLEAVNCKCENPVRWYHGRDGYFHCSQCDGRPLLVCPGCGATEDAGCVIDVGAKHFDRATIGRQLLCVGHERPYWLTPASRRTETDHP